MIAIWIVEGWRAHPGVAAMEVRDQDAFPFAAAGIVRCHGNDAAVAAHLAGLVGDDPAWAGFDADAYLSRLERVGLVQRGAAGHLELVPGGPIQDREPVATCPQP